jgi:hypothetical protein
MPVHQGDGEESDLLRQMLVWNAERGRLRYGDLLNVIILTVLAISSVTGKRRVGDVSLKMSQNVVMMCLLDNPKKR